MEARVNRLHRMGGERVHVAEEFIQGEKYIDPAKWSPLLYDFRHYFRLALGRTYQAED